MQHMIIDSDELKNLYDKELKSILGNLDKRKRKAYVRSILIAVISTSAYLLIKVFISSHPELKDNLAIFVALPFLGYYAFKLKLDKDYREKVTGPYKNEVLRRIIHLVDNELDYQPNRFIDKEQILASGLFPVSYCKFKGDDLIKGKFDEVPFEFSDVHLQCNKYLIHKNDKPIGKLEEVLCTSFVKSKDYCNVFIGQFFHANFNKMILGEIFVVPRRSWARRKIYPDFYYPKNISEVYVANQEFSKHFVIYSNNAVEAQYVLTPRFMELLLLLQKKWAQPFGMTVINNQLSLAIPSGINHFELTMKYSKTDYDFIHSLHGLITLLSDLVSDLQLNQRIWGKPFIPKVENQDNTQKTTSNLMLGQSVARRQDKH